MSYIRFQYYYYCLMSACHDTRCCNSYFVNFTILNEITVSVVCIDTISYLLFVQDIISLCDKSSSDHVESLQFSVC